MVDAEASRVAELPRELVLDIARECMRYCYEDVARARVLLICITNYAVVLLLAGGDEDEAFACLLKELGPRSIFTKAAFEMLVSRAGKATEIEKQLAECRRERQIP